MAGPMDRGSGAASVLTSVAVVLEGMVVDYR